MLAELIYTSLATRPMTADFVAAIADQAQGLNRRHLITGYLSCRAGSVLQLLEGREDLIRDTFSRIERDPRHRQVRLVRCGPIARRRFQEWSMHAVLVDLNWAERLAGAAGFGRGAGLAPARYQRVRTAEEAHALITLSLKFEGHGLQPPSGPGGGAGGGRVSERAASAAGAKPLIDATGGVPDDTVGNRRNPVPTLLPWALPAR